MAALECVRLGITPEIVDAKPEPSKLSRAVGILPRSIELLTWSGVGEQLKEQGVKAGSVHIQKNNKTLFKATFEKEERGIIGLPQDQTELLMSKALTKHGVTVQYDTAVEFVKNSDDNVVVDFKTGEQKAYDWVIGADGIRSTVRQSLNIDFSGYDLPEEWSIADIEILSEYDQYEFKAWLLDNKEMTKDVLVMVPIAPKRVRLVSSTPDSLAALPLQLKVKEIRRSGTFTISVRQAAQYVRGRVLLAGDAAHVHSPVGGRGMNLGIEDGAMAARAIVENKVIEYNQERRARANKIIKDTEAIRKALVSNNFLTSLLIAVLATLINTIPAAKNIFVKRVTSL